MAELAFLNSRAFTKRTGGPLRSPRPRRGGGRVLSVGTLVVGVVACHLEVALGLPLADGERLRLQVYPLDGD